MLGLEWAPTLAAGVEKYAQVGQVLPSTDVLGMSAVEPTSDITGSSKICKPGDHAEPSWQGS